MQGYSQVPFCLCAAAFCLAEAIKNGSEAVHSYFFAAQRLVRWMQGANEEIRRGALTTPSFGHPSKGGECGVWSSVEEVVASLLLCDFALKVAPTKA